MNREKQESLILSVRQLQLDLTTPKVVGILNTTPDSFSDGGKFTSVQQALDRIGQMVDEGAAIIDIGGESTRPGSDPVSEQVEMKRTLPVFQAAVKEFPDTFFSVDTTKYRVAEEALKAGAHIVNDVSGLEKEPRFAELCAAYSAGYVLMHSQGDPKTMQKNPVYEDVLSEVFQFLRDGIERLRIKNVQSIIIDPGIGFGKTLAHNLELVAGLNAFGALNCPVLVGASRKSMIGQILDNRPVEGRLAGSIAVHYHCLLNGAKLLRVHDVREAADSISIFEAVQRL